MRRSNAKLNANESSNSIIGLAGVLLTRFVHSRKSQIQGLSKDIQDHVSANARTKYWREGEISKMWRWSWIVKKRRNFNEFQTALSDMSMQNECLYFRKYLYKKNLRTFKYFFTNSRTFKALNFCFQIQGHSRTFKFVRTLSTNERETNYLDMHG